jgi:hypothetical protein
MAGQYTKKHCFHRFFRRFSSFDRNLVTATDYHFMICFFLPYYVIAEKNFSAYTRSTTSIYDFI